MREFEGSLCPAYANQTPHQDVTRTIAVRARTTATVCQDFSRQMTALQTEIRLTHFKGNAPCRFIEDFPPEFSALICDLFSTFRFVEAVLGLESSLKNPITDDNPLLISLCGGIEAVFRQGLKSESKQIDMYYHNYWERELPCHMQTVYCFRLAVDQKLATRTNKVTDFLFVTRKFAFPSRLNSWLRFRAKSFHPWSSPWTWLH